jgi:hypothetical protein
MLSSGLETATYHFPLVEEGATRLHCQLGLSLQRCSQELLFQQSTTQDSTAFSSIVCVAECEDCVYRLWMLVRAYCGCRLRHVLLRNIRRAFTIGHRSRHSVRRVSHLCNSKSSTPISNLVPAVAPDSLYWTVNVHCASSPAVFYKAHAPTMRTFPNRQVWLHSNVTARSNLFDTTCSKNRPCCSEF